MWIFISALIAIFIIILIISKLPQWGKAPSGERKQRILKSPQYGKKQFENFSHTPNFAEGYTMGKIMRQFLFGKKPNNKPVQNIPAQKLTIPSRSEEPIITWFGHSSYLLQIHNKNILVDPVFSGHASPFSFSVNAFKGANIYSVNDMPAIDILLISHDHYDHLDYKTVKQLIPKVKSVVTSLGAGSHLEKWGYDPKLIHELDWWEEVKLDDLKLTAAPSRHFSGRGLKRNLTLWSSFVLETKDKTIYLGGDSGYDSHFKKIGEKWKSFDLVILECGQYNLAWHYIHMLPNEMAQAAKDLNGKILMPVHWGKFALAFHAWNESIISITDEAGKLQIPLLSPAIGESVSIQRPYINNWWKEIN
jgi:L-ascorbate metabolism protein UlaG (beta-lactamase superfamily)